jgi:hypothetical protein
MKAFARKVLLAVAPVLGVIISIAVLRAAGVPFPPELSLAAWAQWTVFAALVYAFTALCKFIAQRFFGAPDAPGPVVPPTA